MQGGSSMSSSNAVRRGWSAIGAAVLCLAAGAGAAQESAKPEREVSLAFEFPRVEVEPSSSVSLDLVVKNNGRRDETLLLELAEAPADLVSRIEDFGRAVGGLFVASGEKRTLKVTLKPKPAKDKKEEEKDRKANVPPGKYAVVVRASTEDKKIDVKARGEITVRSPSDEGGGAKDPVEISCSYPNLRGANDGDFRFSVNIHNNTEVEDMAALRAEAPAGWEVSFKPSYENRYIGSLKVEANLSKSVDVEVKPAPGSAVGKYPITVYAKLSRKEMEAKRELTVELTGTYRLELRTVKGLLSLTGRGGQESNLSIYVVNTGTAALSGIKFDSFKPENWKVTFKPERLESVAPGKMEQVEVIITPHKDALVGDYSVQVSARAERGQDDLELRVTVKPSTAWAWVGVGIIIAVIAGLSALFKVFGRR